MNYQTTKFCYLIWPQPNSAHWTWKIPLNFHTSRCFHLNFNFLFFPHISLKHHESNLTQKKKEEKISTLDKKTICRTFSSSYRRSSKLWIDYVKKVMCTSSIKPKSVDKSHVCSLWYLRAFYISTRNYCSENTWHEESSQFWRKLFSGAQVVLFWLKRLLKHSTCALTVFTRILNASSWFTCSHELNAE